jgi:hypothetical protein
LLGFGDDLVALMQVLQDFGGKASLRGCRALQMDLE